MSTPADIVIGTFDSEAEAVKQMHRRALALRRRRITDRYGVSVEKRRGVWWLILHDRGDKP